MPGAPSNGGNPVVHSLNVYFVCMVGDGLTGGFGTPYGLGSIDPIGCGSDVKEAAARFVEELQIGADVRL